MIELTDKQIEELEDMTEEEWGLSCGALDEPTMRAMALIMWGSFILFAVVVLAVMGIIRLAW